MDNIYFQNQSSNGNGSYHLASKVQKWGVLWKKPFGPTTSSKQNASSKWSKRFFVVKEGFLLYYPENEKRDFEKRRFFNLHPKGIVPLGGSIVEPMNDPGKTFAIKIEHDDISGAVVIATDSELDREKWIDILRRSGRITWKNAELGESMIQTLEKQSLQLAKDSQRYRDQLHEGAQALREEMDKSEELEKIAVELENEKKKIEEMANELLAEKARTQSEFQETLDALKELEREKVSLSDTSSKHQETLQLLEREKEETLANLKRKEEEAKQLADQNMSLSDTTSTLKEDLEKIEQRRKDLEADLQNIQSSLKEKELETQALEEEKIVFSEQAKQLESSLQDLAVQKEMTDQELKEEILARRDAERRLKKAEDSLSKLEAALKERDALTSQKKMVATATPEEGEETTKTLEKMRTSSTIDEDIHASVADLKSFFEAIAMEAAIDANKPIIMKNAVHARKSFIRKTKSFKLRKDRDLRHRHSIAVFGHLDEGQAEGPGSDYDPSARNSLAVSSPSWKQDNRRTVSFDLFQTETPLSPIPEIQGKDVNNPISNGVPGITVTHTGGDVFDHCPDETGSAKESTSNECSNSKGQDNVQGDDISLNEESSTIDVSESEGEDRAGAASGSSVSDSERD